MQINLTPKEFRRLLDLGIAADVVSSDGRRAVEHAASAGRYPGFCRAAQPVEILSQPGFQCVEGGGMWPRRWRGGGRNRGHDTFGPQAGFKPAIIRCPPANDKHLKMLCK